MKTENSLVTQDGEVTPLGYSTSPVSMVDRQALQEKIRKAAKAKDSDYTDVTPIYWEARQGESQTMAFMGFKPINKKDDAGNVVGQDFAAVFFDGQREVVCNQVALKDAMKTKEMGNVYKITCTLSVAKQAKKFTVLEFND